METEQFNAILKQLDDAQWFNGIYLAGLSAHCNWEIICKFSGIYRDVHGNYSFNIDEWRKIFEDEGMEDYSLKFFESITK